MWEELAGKVVHRDSANHAYLKNALSLIEKAILHQTIVMIAFNILLSDF